MTRWGSVLAMLALVLGLGAPAAAPGAPEDRRSRRVAKAAEDDGANAQEAYKNFQYGVQFYGQGLLRQAEESFRKALATQPSYPEANYMLALVYRELKDYPAALWELGEALRIHPLFTECHNVIGLIHAEMGRYDEALKEFQVVASDVSFPTPEVAHFNIGKVFWEKKECGEAVLHFRKALELNPQFGRAWYLMGDCQETMSQRAQAKDSYLKAIELLGDEPGPMYRLGFLCFQDGDLPCAQRWFDRVLTLAPASESAAAAREYMRQMNFR